MEVNRDKQKRKKEPGTKRASKRQKIEPSLAQPAEGPEGKVITSAPSSALITSSPFKTKQLQQAPQPAVQPYQHVPQLERSDGPPSMGTRSKVKRTLKLDESTDSPTVLFSPSLKFTAEIALSSSSSESSEDLEFVQLDTDEFNPFQFIALLPSVKPDHDVPTPLLPAKTKKAKYTLVLDLDETLVHSEVQPQSKEPFLANRTIKLEIQFNGASFEIVVGVRPGFDAFMKYASEHFEVVLFTASNQVYANPLIDLLDPDRTYFDFRLFRESCLLVNENYIKDLSALGRDLSTVIMIDNSPHVFGYQLDNGIPIEDWFYDPSDTHLTTLLSVLRDVHEKSANDIRPFLRKKYKLYKKVRIFNAQISSILSKSGIPSDEKSGEVVSTPEEQLCEEVEEDNEDEYDRSKRKKKKTETNSTM